MKGGSERAELRLARRGAMSRSVESDGVAKRYGSLVARRGSHLRGAAGRDPRRARAERRRQDDGDPDPDDDPRRRRAGTFAVAGVPHTRPRRSGGGSASLPESAGYPERRRARNILRYHARLYGHGRASAARACGDAARRGRPRRARPIADRDVQPRHAPAAGHRPRARQRPAGRLPRRADARARPGRAAPGARRLVRRIARERGATVLLSTHLLAEVEEICSRVLILNRGRVVADGTVAEVARRAAAPRSGDASRPRRAGRGAPARSRRWRASSASSVDGQPGPAHGRRSTAPMRRTRRCGALVDAGVRCSVVRARGARLSDAFLAMTEAA